MNDQKPVDWLAASTDERRQLYRVLRAIADTTGQSVEELMQQALGQRLLTGADYLSNVRKGKISRSKARLIHAWVARAHPAIAATIAPELFNDQPQPQLQPNQPRVTARSEIGVLLPDHIPDPILEPHSFSRYVDEHAIEGPLRIISLAPRKGLVQRVGEERRKTTQTLKLGEPFCFELDSPSAGQAIVLQGYQGRWHPVPLDDDAEAITTLIEYGKNQLPSSVETRESRPLIETVHTGDHRFVAIALANNGNISAPASPAYAINCAILA